MSGNFDTNKAITHLIRDFEKSQYTHQPKFELIKDLPVLTRNDLRKIQMKKGVFCSKTSGSTGEPVSVEKTIYDYIWGIATNTRELLWRGWDFSKKRASIKPSLDKKEKIIPHWGVPKEIAPIQGNWHHYYYATINEIQNWLEKINPYYLHCAPTIVKQLDLGKIKNLLDVKGTGEVGGTMYSSEECGTIAIQCPDNKENYHVMENIIVEVNENNEIIITSLTNPYIKRYKHGDVVELGKCTCDRTLQTITKIHGRKRNMFHMKDGNKKWPLFGSRTYYEKYGIKQFKVIQKTLENLEIQIICEKLDFQTEINLKKEICELLESDLTVDITYVSHFSNYKHEEFVSLLENQV
jgi:phenylacetate-CoA ligase